MVYKDKEKNKRCQRKSRIRRRELRRDLVNEYKQEKGCSKCGYSENPVALDFHHLGDKDKPIAHMVQKCFPIETIFAEIKKCIVICANCHRILHNE